MMVVSLKTVYRRSLTPLAGTGKSAIKGRLLGCVHCPKHACVGI